MTTTAIKTVFPFLAAGFDASTAGVQYTTPNALAHKLGALQAINYKRADFKAHNQSDAAVTATLKQGTTTLGTLALAAGAANAVEVDLAGVSGAARITLEVDVTSIGTGTGFVHGILDVEQPIIVSSC